jgi:hypothetical protein
MVQLHGSLLQLQSHLQDLRRSELQLEARDVIASQDEVQLAVPDAMNDWLADLPTQLEVSIGERNLERAVALLETGARARARA